MKATVRKGFTLIEILIVVIILGILAAIVIPQFTNASKDAKVSSAKTLIQTVRSQIELYKLEQGVEPDLVTDGWTKMLEETNGKGPYLQSKPVNPLAAAGAGSLVGTAVVSNTTGLPSSAAQLGVGFVQEKIGGRIWILDDKGLPMP